MTHFHCIYSAYIPLNKSLQRLLVSHFALHGCVRREFFFTFSSWNSINSSLLTLCVGVNKSTSKCVIYVNLLYSDAGKYGHEKSNCNKTEKDGLKIIGQRVQWSLNGSGGTQEQPQTK